eukprot:SAG31_NODE_11458_length_1028_cov_0.537137_2_plen_183_part_01
MLIKKNPDFQASNLNVLLAEALVVFVLVKSLEIVDTSQFGLQIAGTSAIVWYMLRFAYQYKRRRAEATVHALGLPGATIANPHKGTFPVLVKVCNDIVEEFFAVKGVSKDCATHELKSVVPFRLPLCRHKCDSCSQTHRFLLVGQKHFLIEKTDGIFTDPASDMDAADQHQTPKSRPLHDVVN